MPEPTLTLSDRLKARFGDKALAVVEAHGETTLEVSAAAWRDVATAMRDEIRLHAAGSGILPVRERAHRHAKENFLITRHLREYLTMAIGLLQGERHPHRAFRRGARRC